MPGLHAMKVPEAARGAALVSVDGRAYPLESARVEAEASGGTACSKLVQTYRNPYAEALEVVYTLPLPADGAVVGYSMRLGGRVIRGEVRSREEAKAAYQKAMFEGRSAALLEQDRDDTFTQRLGMLPGGQSAEITIEVMHPLSFLAGVGESGPEWEYRFPTVVGVRYQGADGRVPDADRLDVDRADGPGTIPTRIELSLTTIDETGTATRRVEAMPLDRDLVVRWEAGQAAIGAHLVEGPGLPGDDGRYGMLTITPPRVSTATFARDVTILLDASGSMSGLPIAWAKDVAAGMLRTLGEGDRFEVIAFSSQPRSLTGGIVPATQRSLTAALDELTRLRASGGTEMASAVVRALQPLRHDAQHQVVLITDGQIGFEHEIVARIVEGLPERARLHTVGVGAAPNRTLTLRAARAGRGVESFVCGDSEVPATIARLNAATARPVLTDIAIASTAIRGVAPARPRDVLAGQPLVVALELAQAGGTIAVSGKLAGSTEPWTWQLTVPPVAAREGAVTKVPLGALYGRELIADFDMSRPGSDDHVRNVALRHRIASRMTSLVAISEEATVDPKAPRRGVVLPVEVPAYMSAEGLGLMSGQGVWDAVFMESRPREDAAEFRAWDVKASLEPRFLDKLLGKFRARAVAPMGTNARVLAVEGNLLVVEIEAPLDGFLCPSGRVVVMAGEQVIGAGTIDPVQSSPRGPHAKGLLLRVAILGTASWLCQAGDEVTVIGGTSA